MNRFKFRMEGILNIKQKFEDQAKAAFSSAKGVLYQEEEKLRLLEETKLSYEHKLCELMKSILVLIEIQRYELAIDAKKEQIELQKIEVERVRKLLELARIRLKDAVLERKTYEKLRDKAWESYREEYEIEERKQVDELVSYVYGLRARTIGQT